MEKERMPGLIIVVIVLAMLSTGITCAEEITNFTRGERTANTLRVQDLPAVNVAADSPGLVTADLKTDITPEELVNALLGGGVAVSNVTFTGANAAAGTLSGGTGIIGFENGIILSSGNISKVIGPNQFDNVAQVNGFPGDPDLDALIPGFTTLDAAVLEFDFVPAAKFIQFEYVFGSDEYNEYVNTQYNDVFGFFLNGENIALIPGTNTPVSINNVNKGNPFGMNPSNPAYYINNDLDDGGGAINTEMDGLTVVLTATATVNPGETNHIKLAIADAGDSILDSNVILRAESFVSPLLTLEPELATNQVGQIHSLIATFKNETGAPIVGEAITFNITEGPHAGVLGTSITNASGIATWNYTETTPGNDTIIATGGGQSSNKAIKKWIISTAPKLTLEPEKATNLLGSTHVLKATLVDGAGTPIAGETITFNVTAGPYAGTSGTGVTGANGTATWAYGVNPGTDTIIASGGGLTSNAATKTWEMPSGTRLTLEPKKATNEIGNCHKLKASLSKDDGSKPGAGTLVTFSIISGPHAGISGTGMTDMDGVATWCYFGINSGNDTIIASSGGQVSEPVFKDWKIDLTELTLKPETATNLPGETHKLTAELVTITGEPLAGELVTFNVTSGPHAGTSGTGITSTEGLAFWNYTGTVTGKDTIVATSNGKTSNEAFKVWMGLLGTKSRPDKYASNVLANVLMSTVKLD